MGTLLAAFFGAMLGAAIVTIAFNVFSAVSLPVRIAKVVASGAMDAYDSKVVGKLSANVAEDFEVGYGGTVYVEGKSYHAVANSTQNS